MKKMMFAFLCLIVAVGFSIPYADAATVDVVMIDSSFVPQNVMITVGDTVRWKNFGALTHTATSGTGGNPDGLWNSGSLFFGGIHTLTFEEAGVFPYYCTFHWASGMTGTVTVNAATSSLPVPGVQQVIPYAPPVSDPELSNNPLSAKPVGIGPLALGGDTLDVSIGLNETSGSVDVYLAYSRLADPQTLNILLPGGFTPFSLNQIVNAVVTGSPLPGFEPWIANTMGPIDVNLLTIPTSSLPPDVYTAYLLVTQAGVLNKFYVWITIFSIP